MIIKSLFKNIFKKVFPILKKNFLSIIGIIALIIFGGIIYEKINNNSIQLSNIDKLLILDNERGIIESINKLSDTIEPANDINRELRELKELIIERDRRLQNSIGTVKKYIIERDRKDKESISRIEQYQNSIGENNRGSNNINREIFDGIEQLKDEIHREYEGDLSGDG